MRISEQQRAEKMYVEDPLRFASEATDYGWSFMTGHCGGCGSHECHDGPCGGHPCALCPERRVGGGQRDNE